MKKVLLLALMFISASSLAKDCAYTEVKAIQVQKSGHLVLLKTSTGSEHWKTMGSSTSNFINAYLSVAQQALATNKRLVLRYPDGYECNKTEYSVVPDMIRIVK